MKLQDLFKKPELRDFSNLHPINIEHGTPKTPFIKELAPHLGLAVVDQHFDKNLSPFTCDRNEPVCVFLDEICIGG